MRKTPLEQWISEKIHGRTGRELIWDSIRGYQLEKLRTVIDHVLEKSPFYRERLRGISGKDLQSVDDISALPMTSADDLRHSGPRFLCTSQSEVDRVVTLQSLEKNEAPRRLYFSGNDLELTIDFFHHGMTTLVNEGQKALILMPGARPGSVGDLLAKALARAGGHGFVHGVVTDPEKTISEIVEKEIDCIVGIPTQVLSLARSEKADRIHEGRISSVLLSSDYVPSSVINELRRTWGCKVFGHYGTTEMGLGGGVECEAFDGYHLREADLLFEVVDPASGRPLPDGRLGEVVFTTLTRDAMPLIRYRTGDLSRFIPDPCPCGTVLRRLAKVRGKTHDGVSLRSGDWLRIADLDETLFVVPGIANYQVSLTKSDHVDRLELIMYPGSCRHQPQLDKILGAVNSVPAIARAVETGDLIVEPIRFSNENWVTTGAVKRAILQKILKE
jgi:phenylacetate-CoA ligase